VIRSGGEAGPLDWGCGGTLPVGGDSSLPEQAVWTRAHASNNPAEEGHRTVDRPRMLCPTDSHRLYHGPGMGTDDKGSPPAPSAVQTPASGTDPLPRLGPEGPTGAHTVPGGIPEEDLPPASADAVPNWMPSTGPTFARYQLLGRLAVGGMAEVYLAREVMDGGASRFVVVKCIDNTDRDVIRLFMDEARLIMQLGHPSICHTYAFGEAAGRPYLALEWIDGMSAGALAERVAQEGAAIPLPFAISIIAQIADALDYAHRATDATRAPLAIVHRDVSPHNIMLSFTGAVKLLDFGVAQARSRLTKTRAGVIRGKFAYMSPEQCVGRPLDGRSDIFSLGICLWEILTGVSLFGRVNQFETMREIVDGTVPSLREERPDLPEALDAIVQKALAKDREDRYATAGAMHEALSRLLIDMKESVSTSRLAAYLTEVDTARAISGPELTTDTELMRGLRSQEGVAAEAGTKTRRSRLPLVALLALAVPLAAVAVTSTWGSSGTPPGPARRQEPTPQTGDEGTPPPRPRDAGATTGPVVAPTGAVRFVSEPPGAEIIIDGESVDGTTPTTIGDVPVGQHSAVLRLAGHAPWRGLINVSDGQTTEITRTLSATAEPASIAVNTTPWSHVYLGRRLLGTTPIARKQVPSGNVRLRFVDGRGRSFDRTVRLRPGEHRSVFYRFE